MHSDLYKHKLGITARKRATGNDRSMLVSRSHGGGSSHGGTFGRDTHTHTQRLLHPCSCCMCLSCCELHPISISVA